MAMDDRTMTFRRVLFLFLFAVLVVGAAWFFFIFERQTQSGAVSPSAVVEAEPAITVPRDIAYEKFPFSIGDRTGTMHVYAFVPGDFQPRVAYDATPKHISTWGGGEQRLVLNGGFFHEDYTPSGYLVVDGQRIGNRMFDQELSGLVSIQYGNLTIRDLAEQPLLEGEKFGHALQSFPFLIKHGKPAVQEDSGLLARRSAIGADRTGNILLIMVPEQISLYEFAQELERIDIDFDMVLNLDGGPSSGLYIEEEDYRHVIDSFVPVPSVLVFERKPQPNFSY